MKDWKVVIKPMSKAVNNGRVITKEYHDEKEAFEYFAQWCDQHGYEYNSLSVEAGGIGHDYRISIELNF